MRTPLVVVLGLLWAAAAAHGQQRGAVDWVFLVDTSQSMRGVGGTKNIFGDVQESLQTFVREASDGDSVSIYTFDRDVRSHGLRDVRSQFDREELFETVRTLEANGNRTHLGAAIAKGLERSEALLQRGDSTRVRALVLFTDGKEDVRGIASPVSIPENVQRALKSRPLMFFVSLGEHERQLDDFPNATVLKAQDVDGIKRVAHEIRSVLERDEPKPQPAPKLTVTPAILDFGEVAGGEASPERELTLSSNVAMNVTVALTVAPGVTMSPQSITLAPNVDTPVRVQLDVGEDAAPGAREATIRIGTAAVAARLSVAEPSLVARVAKWLAAIALLALLLIAGAGWNKRRNELEGELEIVKPRVAADAAYVGLPNMKASEVALSAIVPLDALAGNDARLFVRRTRGEKKVWIAAQSGTLRVNDVELPAAELYDADTIRIGDATLRFNRIGHERPSLQEEPA